jgi:hypothetical protein
MHRTEAADRRETLPGRNLAAVVDDCDALG